jgi:hypothetical protein
MATKQKFATLKQFLNEFDAEYKAGNFGKPVDDEVETPLKKVSFDLELFIKLMEFARENAQNDEIIHTVTENIERLMTTTEVLTMDNYQAILGPEGEQEEEETYDETN